MPQDDANSPSPAADSVHTKQFETLGRYVQDFEFMIHAVRSGCIGTVANGSKGKFEYIQIAFNHSAMSANTLYEIYRAYIATALRGHLSHLPEKDKDALRSIMKDISKDFPKAVKNRNNLLHGTWYIGYGDGVSEPSPEVPVLKFKVTKGGIQSAPKLSDIEALRALSSECRRLTQIFFLLTAVLGNLGPPTKFFKHEEGRWVAKGSIDG